MTNDPDARIGAKMQRKAKAKPKIDARKDAKAQRKAKAKARISAWADAKAQREIEDILSWRLFVLAGFKKTISTLPNR